LAQTKRNELLSLVQLYKALGGGWQVILDDEHEAPLKPLCGIKIRNTVIQVHRQLGLK